VVAICGWTTWAHPAAEAPSTAARNAAKAKSPFQQLEGRWQRTDGGYIVDIRSVELGGKIDATYFNPRPIHVAIAEASQTGTTIRVVIELRDANYPGSTYRLTYDALNDRLNGTYFQAAIKQTFDVSFLRIKS
jgi:hypothetical protein